MVKTCSQRQASEQRGHLNPPTPLEGKDQPQKSQIPCDENTNKDKSQVETKGMRKSYKKRKVASILGLSPTPSDIEEEAYIPAEEEHSDADDSQFWENFENTSTLTSLKQA